MIEEITKYLTMGREFRSLEEAEAYRRDLIGEFMDTLPRTLSPRDRLALVQFIVDNRAMLRGLLDY